MRRALILLLVACGRTGLTPLDTEPPVCARVGWRPGVPFTVASPYEASASVATLLDASAVQVWPGAAQSFDWLGRPLGPSVAVPATGFVYVSPLGGAAGLAWVERGTWHTARLDGAQLTPGGTYPAEPGLPKVVEAGGRLLLGVGGDEHVVVHGAAQRLELGPGGRIAHAFADGDSSVWLWSPKDGPTQLSRVSLDGARLAPDVTLFAGPVVDPSTVSLRHTFIAAASCGDGELAFATLETLSQQTPLRSRLSLGRMRLDGSIVAPLTPVAADDHFAWMPALWCDADHTAIVWVENVAASAGGLVSATRLMFDDGTGAVALDDLAGSAAYFPRLSRSGGEHARSDGDDLVVAWVRYGDAGYSSHLMKLGCR
ncbi:MAG: hypothetical protein JNK82_14160 [Myxococcaceae bacterium]|nr:hypothetical protein [Myxococcaceae bacterium]